MEMGEERDCEYSDWWLRSYPTVLGPETQVQEDVGKETSQMVLSLGLIGNRATFWRGGTLKGRHGKDRSMRASGQWVALQIATTLLFSQKLHQVENSGTRSKRGFHHMWVQIVLHYELQNCDNIRVNVPWKISQANLFFTFIYLTVLSSPNPRLKM